MKITTAFVSLLCILQLSLTGQLFIGETEIDTTTIITGLDIPWEIQWGHDDQIWTTERFGRVSRIDPQSGAQDVILDISDVVFQSGESGLLGMVLHPDFETDPYVFLAYTYRTGGQILERIVRYEYNGQELVDELTLLDNIQGNTTHDGCRMIILPDNTLLFTTGDAQNQPAAQNLNHLSGKTLRLNLDGSIPDDNPFSNNAVYSFGHRNAQGLFHGPNGIIYSSEHGPNTDDEFNIIQAGRNFGWPNVHGFCNLPNEITFCEENNVKEPLVAWTPTVAASDIIYYDHPSIPEWENHVLMTTLKNKRLYDLELNGDGTTVIDESQYFTNWWGRLRDICMSPDGAIYLATNGPSWSNTEPFTHSIVKIWNPEYVSVEEKESFQIKLYPNPATDFIQVSTESHMSGSQLKMYSSDGKLILQQFLQTQKTKISIEGFNTGLYYVSITKNNAKIYSEKLFIIND